MQTLIDLRYMYVHANAASVSVVLSLVVQTDAVFDSCKNHSNDRIMCLVLPRQHHKRDHTLISRDLISTTVAAG